MNTLTVPKIRDLVNKPNQQYQDIYSTMAAASPPTFPSSLETSSSISAVNNGIADELSSFLNDLKKTAPEKKNIDFDTFSNTNDIGYSVY